MNTTKDSLAKIDAWKIFCEEYKLSQLQQEQYLTYTTLLLSENQKYNLTAITDLEDIVHYHFEDALCVTRCINIASYKAIADIGSGCGVPGIILACFIPESHFYLIEVSKKRIEFLEKAFIALNITNCTIAPLDFKTYIRKSNIPIDLFLARASLALQDLLFIYSGLSHSQNASLIYWSSLGDKSHCFSQLHHSLYHEEYAYQVGDKKREYVFFSKK